MRIIDPIRGDCDKRLRKFYFWLFFRVRIIDPIRGDCDLRQRAVEKGWIKSVRIIDPIRGDCDRIEDVQLNSFTGRENH